MGICSIIQRYKSNYTKQICLYDREVATKKKKKEKKTSNFTVMKERNKLTILSSSTSNVIHNTTFHIESVTIIKCASLNKLEGQTFYFTRTGFDYDFFDSGLFTNK